MRRILIVEDSQVMNVYYKSHLSAVPDCALAFAGDGQQALTHIQAHGAPALIILDINMPVMNGLEFLLRHRALWPDSSTRIIIVTTEGSEDDCRRGLEAGADSYLKKPFEPHHLVDLITRHVRQG
jgi:DNA-binding response OmpR family regulator